MADKMPDQIDEQVKTARSDRLLELTAQQKKKFEESFNGETDEVLVEEIVEIRNKKYLRGHTMRYILVDIPAPDDAEKYINTIIKWDM